MTIQCLKCLSKMVKILEPIIIHRTKFSKYEKYLCGNCESELLFMYSKLHQYDIKNNTIQ